MIEDNTRPREDTAPKRQRLTAIRSGGIQHNTYSPDFCRGRTRGTDLALATESHAAETFVNNSFRSSLGGFTAAQLTFSNCVQEGQGGHCQLTVPSFCECSSRTRIGRGLRISPDKDRLIVLDFVTDLRRISEVIELDRAVKGGDIERLGLGNSLISFMDHSAGSFLREWMLDQASLMLREGDPQLEVPRYEYPESPPPGGVE